ncbi:hypothetical protein HHK36_019798 [Tetracentron sinense]|uniref:NB-ARC domain-containing protein n=1 Tax=Tetracentron sinense TaxID=13715 RepID=A0A834YU95_TETSI|nr:hypothetical protein HHK36_019798 [Tetracentron sinense]
MEFLICVVEKMGDYLVAPIARQFGYLIYYNSNIENLRKEVEKLKNTRDGVQGLVDAAERNVEEIRADVRKWLIDTDNIIEKVGMWNENVIVNGCCPDCSWHYRISKEAKKKILDIDELQKNGKFDSVSFPAPPPGIDAISAGDFMLFKSTESTMDQIMEALKDDNVNIIGLNAVGGVGKTTLVQEVGKRAKEEKLFDEVVMAVVSKHPDIKKIQEQIADMLGLKFSETTDLGRAGQLTERLANGKRILIIMDDVWARLDLAAVGIPFGNDHKGTCVNTPDINVVAMEVAKRCGGLPMLLVTVGRALVDKDLDEWKKAARKLKESKPINEQDVDYKVFSCLRLSYDYLKGEETKACFLLCSLFPEDCYISIESLTRYGMGQGLFQDVDTLEEARGKAHTTIKHLKASCLLLDDFDNDFVRMHDVVRHVAKTIASKDKHVLVRPGEAGLKEWPNKGTFEHDTGISLMDNDIVELPLGLECPKLQILLLQNNTNLKEIPGAFFEGMKSLKVLDLTNTNVKEIPTSIRFLTNLRILHLKNCKSIIDISPIVELKKLEILSLVFSSIECLPEKIGQLTKLRLLDLRGCERLKTIPPNVISSLSQLEELCMAWSLVQWEVEEGTSNRSNASFAELKSLPRLTRLSIDIRDVECLSNHFSFPNLIRFDIYVGPCISTSFATRKEKPKSTKLYLEKIQMPSGDGIKVWLEKTKNLWIKKIEGIKTIFPDIEGLNGLKYLYIRSDDEIECLVNATEWIPRVVFSNLEVLDLFYMHSLKEMCIGLLPSGSFSELRHLSVNSCDKLLIVVPSNLLPRLQNLTKLEVFWGSALEEVFNLEGIIEKGDDQLLSTLRSLRLGYLPRLMDIWKGPSRLLCLHKLKEVEVVMCATLRYIFSLSLTQSLLQLDVLRISYCNELEGIMSKDKEEEVVAWKKGPRGFARFQHLRVVQVTHCNNLINLFSSSIARDLSQIEELTIRRCERMEVVVTKEMEGEEAVDKIVFPQLKKLELWDLSNLTCFCPGSFPFEWPSLEFLSVNRCFKMITFTAADTDAASTSTSTSTPGFQSTPKLKTIRVDEKYMLDGGDINTIIQIYVKEKGGIEAISAGDFTLVKSTESATDQIMEALKDDNVNIIGLYGVGGRLTKRLANGKRILIIMDDVWARLDLVAVGIPFGNDHKGTCVNTPDINVVAMEVAKRCGGLPMLLVTVGRALVDKDLDEWKEAAKILKDSKPTDEQDVVHEVFSCLKLSYDYLKGEETKACFLLCSLFPEDHQIEIEDLARYGMGQGLFQDVDTIEEARGKAHTTIEHLKASCLLLDGFNNDFIKMHDVVRHVAKTIASKDKHVLVRAGEAGLKEWPNKGTFEHDTGISLMDNDIVELPHGLECPKLQILLLQNNTNLKEIPGAFFEGMKSLKVLDLTNTNVKQIPTSIRFLTNLRILHLKRCKSIIDISPIVELKKLEILSLAESSIECLPEEIGQLTKLRFLDLTACQSLKTIPPNVISSLTQLEEFYMASSFAQWEVEEGTSNRSNVSFAELKSLPRLTSLSIDIRDVECLSKHFSFPNLIWFDIFVCSTLSWPFIRYVQPKSTKLSLEKIQMPSGDGIKVWLEKTKNVLWLEKIEGIKTILPDMDDQEGLNGLKSLYIWSDDEIECLVNATEWIPRVVFSNLEILWLSSMHSLKEMCIGLLPSRSFSELISFYVITCHKLLTVVPSNLLPRLQNLTRLEVFCGSALEEVFNLEGIIEKGDDQLLSTLRALRLGNLPRLMHIWKGPSRLLCLHKLKEVEVDMCATLRYIFSLSLTQSLLQLDVLRISNCNELEGIISKDKEEEVVAWKKGPRGFACFQHLRVVEVTHCNNLINLFSSFIARDLPEIAELTIGGCERMEVIVTKEMDGEEAVDKIVFPQLKKLELWDLSNLTCFCPGSFPFEWPSLEYLSVNRCFKMITFTAADTDAASTSTSAHGFQSTPKLKTIRVDEKYMLDGGDLNAIIQIYVKEKGGNNSIVASSNQR